MLLRWCVIRIAKAGLGLFVVGCATFQNTLAQDRTWAAYAVCRDTVSTNIRIQRVDPDGRWWGESPDAPYGYAELSACMQSEIAHPSKLGTTQAPTAGVSSAAGATAQGRTAITEPFALPLWAVGDEWEYRYASPTGNGTFVWSVVREEAVDGVPHYVIRSGTRELFYRKSDFASSRETVGGAVVFKNTPARFYYVWPMKVGQTWDQAYVEERPQDRQTSERVDTVTVEAEETVTVPAGTFQALKLVYRNKKTGGLRYEAWYALEVKQVVKLRENLGSGLRVRELIAFRLR